MLETDRECEEQKTLIQIEKSKIEESRVISSPSSLPSSSIKFVKIDEFKPSISPSRSIAQTQVNKPLPSSLPSSSVEFIKIDEFKGLTSGTTLPSPLPSSLPLTQTVGSGVVSGSFASTELVKRDVYNLPPSGSVSLPIDFSIKRGGGSEMRNIFMDTVSGDTVSGDTYISSYIPSSVLVPNSFTHSHSPFVVNNEKNIEVDSKQYMINRNEKDSEKHDKKVLKLGNKNKTNNSSRIVSNVDSLDSINYVVSENTKGCGSNMGGGWGKGLTLYLVGNYTHYTKSSLGYMMAKQGVSVLRDMSNKYKYDFGVRWIPNANQVGKNMKVNEYGKFINGKLKGTRKDFVANTFERVFGYSLSVNPLKYIGVCVGKSNGNGTKSCFFVNCPIKKDNILVNHAYQKVVTYSSNENMNILYEIRVPIFRNVIPFVFFKHRNKDVRFTKNNIKVEVVPVRKYLSKRETEMILIYAWYIGLDYGEMDILRDDSDGRIYIIDVNNTAWWPPNKLGDRNRCICLNMFWNAFLEAFKPELYKKHHVPDNLIDDYDRAKTGRDAGEKRSIVYNDYKYVSHKKLPQL